MSEQKRYKEEGLLTIRQAAERSNFSEWSIRRDIQLRRLASVRRTTRGKIYILTEDLEAYIERYRRSAIGERTSAIN